MAATLLPHHFVGRRVPSPGQVAILQGAVVALVAALAFVLSQAADAPAVDVDRAAITVLVLAAIATPFTAFAIYAARRWVGLSPTPLLGALLGHDPTPARAVLIPGVAVAGALVLIVGSIPLAALLPADVGTTEDSPLERMTGPQILVAFLLVVDEEIVFRLVLLFPIAALLRARADAERRRPGWRGWTAILVAGVLFGAAHVGNIAFLTNVTVEQWLVYSIVQKGLLGGAVFGYVAWRWGLEASILTHYGTNVLLTLLGGLAASAGGG